MWLYRAPLNATIAALPAWSRGKRRKRSHRRCRPARFALRPDPCKTRMRAPAATGVRSCVAVLLHFLHYFLFPPPCLLHFPHYFLLHFPHYFSRLRFRYMKSARATCPGAWLPYQKVIQSGEIAVGKTFTPPTQKSPAAMAPPPLLQGF